MKRGISIMLLVLFLIHPVFSNDYTPYSVDEFPQWSITLRRAETLMFGSLPITLGVTSLTYSVAQTFGASQFSTDPLRDSLTVLGIAGALSIAVALADYIIGEMQN